jgi:hypothetical protein
MRRASFHGEVIRACFPWLIGAFITRAVFREAAARHRGVAVHEAQPDRRCHPTRLTGACIKMTRDDAGRRAFLLQCVRRNCARTAATTRPLRPTTGHGISNDGSTAVVVLSRAPRLGWPLQMLCRNAPGVFRRYQRQELRIRSWKAQWG